MSSNDQSESEGEATDDGLGDVFPEDALVFGGSKRRISDDEAGQDNVLAEKTGQKKRKLKKLNEMKKLKKPPTVEELNRLRETENLFHSNLFRRQIEEMLKELELKSKHKVRINTWFEKFKDVIYKLEDGDESHELSSTDWLKGRKVKVPLTQFGVHSKGCYRFRKPSNIKIVGAYATKTSLGTGSIDITVEMPGQFFDKEDYLNGRYYRKRAIYLCELGKHLEAFTDLVEEVRFACNDGDNWRPVLQIIPAGKLKKSITFLVHLVAGKRSFRLSRFIPTRNNVRSRWLFGEDSQLDDEECPTCEYNSGILRDLRCIENEEIVEEVLGRSPQLRDALILLKVWARQRDLHLGHGAFTGHLLAFLLAYLLHIRKLSLAMSSYQITRTVWNYLRTADWTRSGVSLSEAASDQHQPSMSDFHDHFPVVFVDPSGYLNLCAGMSPLIFRRCQDEAALALHCLDTPDINCFQVLFMTPAPFSRLCDQSIVFHNWEALEKVTVEHSSEKKKMDFCGMIYPQVRDLLVALLEKGLKERVRRLYIQQIPLKTWPLNQKPGDASSLILGLTLDPEYCFSVVDKGPVADAKEAEEFRAFWQERSELRRFKDGSVTESVLWDAKTWQEKRMISRQVTQYLLNAKLGLRPSDFHYVGDDVEATLPKEREVQAGDVVLAYDKLVKTLIGLKDLPLEVISVQGSSPVFRSADVFPPSIPAMSCRSKATHKKPGKPVETAGRCALVNADAHLAPPWCSPADVVIQLGSSNKWPRDLNAVRRIRAAFNLKISQLLTEQCNLVTQAYQDGVHVLTETCVFRLRIIYPGEIALMKKTLAPDGLVLYRDTEESMQIEKSAIHLPKLTSALSGMQSQHSAYGTACCLAKRWVRAHLFHSAHISDEAVDLLMASVFINPEPWQPPNQPQLAFLRFLSLIGHTNWNITCVILNFNEVLTSEEKHEIESHFDSQRASLPCLFIATPDDRKKSVWTRDGPCPVVLLRLVKLAQRALSLLEAQLSGKPSPDILMLFQPSLTAFDVVIHLVAGFVPKSTQALSVVRDETMKNSESLSVIPVLEFDPAECYIKELRESYGDWALFFYDQYGGSSISVVWKPGSQLPREFKVTHLAARRWDRKTNTLHLDTDAILEGFYTLGGRLVKSVHVKKDGRFVPVHF